MTSRNVLLALNYLLLVICLGPVGSVRVCKTFPDYFNPFSPNCWNNTDAELNVTQIVQKWGATAEEHYIRTEDGYEILVVRTYFEVTQSTPIILGHGIYMNSLGFVNLGNKSLPYILNTLGYDVWIINYRGTRYSLGHDNLSSDDKEYWKFSFHEMGIYDLPAVLNLVYTTTNQKAIYVGFSMGTMVSYIYSSTYPEESVQFLKGIISLAPVAYLNGIESVLRLGAPVWPILRPSVLLIWNGRVLPRNDFIGQFCGANPINIFICEFVKAPIFGANFAQVDPEYRPVTNILNPDTIGIDVVTHFSQLITSRNFQQFDYGTIGNLIKYKSVQPPLYKLSNIKVPVSLFVGLNDFLATEQNAVRLCSEIGKSYCNNITYIEDEKWSHTDFVAAKDIKKFVNDPVCLQISRIESNWDDQNMNTV